MLLPAIALGAALQVAASEPATIGETAVSEKIDSILQNTDKLDGLVRRSIVNGGSKPVSFAGEADAKFIASSYLESPKWMLGDKTEFKNSNVTLRMAMVAKPHRNLTLWSKLAFNNAILGYPTPKPNAGMSNMTDDDSGHAAYTVGNDVGDKRGAILYEDMCVGMIMSAGPVSFNFKAGGVLWNEMSPLTVWKTQPRMFGWDYLPYELEQSTAMFYDYATVKGFKEGRAAWNKKPFQGLQLESIDLPWNLYLNTLYGFYEGYNKNNPWQIPVDKTNELQYTDNNSTGTTRTAATKGFGISDNYRPVWFLRLAKGELPGAVTAGFNWFQYIIDKDYPKQWSNRYGYSLTNDDAAVIMTTALTDAMSDSGRRYINNYYIEPRVASMDFRRNIPGGLSFHIDVGASYVDTTWFKAGPAQSGSSTRTRFTKYTNDELDTIVVTGVGGTRKTAPNREDTAIFQREMSKYRPEFREAAATTSPWEEVGRTNSGWKPALYASISYPLPWFELELRSMYADKEFHSGASTIGPINGIFPYESNLTGPGKFAGVDNGTSYSSNLAGSNLIVKIPVPRGHARVSLGLHSQVEKGDDLVYFPWRQNGAAFNATLHSNYTRYGLGLLDDYLREGAATASERRMIRRLGDEMYFRSERGAEKYRNAYAPTPGYAGGMRSDYMAVYEGFATYMLTESWKYPYSSFSGVTRSTYLNKLRAKPTDVAEIPQWTSDSISTVSKFVQDSINFPVDSAKWMDENGEVYRQILANQDSGAFRSQHKKSTQNFSVDLSYEISRLWDGKRSLFLAGYAAFNSVTNGPGSGIPAFKPGKDVLLVGRNLRFEPVYQLTPRFYVIGLVSQETWQSDYGVSMIDTSGMAPGDDKDWLLSEGGLKNLRRAPIDYTDWIYGLGFDWDIAPRVSLHVRGQYFTHEDAGISVDLPSAAGRNDYRAWMGSTEMKMWF